MMESCGVCFEARTLPDFKSEYIAPELLPEWSEAQEAELISGFMKRIGQADHVIVVLSDKYLRSPYCMTELHQIYQRSIRDQEEFLSRIVPLTLEDARIASWQDRVAYAVYWTSQFNALDAQFADKEKRRLLGTGDHRVQRNRPMALPHQ